MQNPRAIFNAIKASLTCNNDVTARISVRPLCGFIAGHMEEPDYTAMEEPDYTAMEEPDYTANDIADRLKQFFFKTGQSNAIPVYEALILAQNDCSKESDALLMAYKGQCLEELSKADELVELYANSFMSPCNTKFTFTSLNNAQAQVDELADACCAKLAGRCEADPEFCAVESC